MRLRCLPRVQGARDASDCKPFASVFLTRTHSCYFFDYKLLILNINGKDTISLTTWNLCRCSLLELAFKKLMCELPRSRYILEGQLEEQVNDLSAIHCLGELRRLNGTEYARIVKRCITCKCSCQTSSLHERRSQDDVYLKVEGWDLIPRDILLVGVWKWSCWKASMVANETS